MDNKTRNRIFKALRTISLSWIGRTRAKNKQKVDKGLFSCSKCGTLCYEGSSDKNFQLMIQKYPDKKVVAEKLQMDHIASVIPLDGWKGWDDHMDRLFCSEDNFRGLCKSCHDSKSKLESTIRARERKKKK